MTLSVPVGCERTRLLGRTVLFCATAAALALGAANVPPAAAEVTNTTTMRAWKLDGAGGPDGRIVADVHGPTAAVLAAGQPHVLTYDRTSGAVRHGWRSAGLWLFETVDGTGGPAGRVGNDVGRSLAAVAVGESVFVFYSDLTTGLLRAARRDARGRWSFRVLDGAGGSDGRVTGRVGAGVSAALAGTGAAARIHVAYVDSGRGALRVGVMNPASGAWRVSDVPRAGNRTSPVLPDTRVVVWRGTVHVLHNHCSFGACFLGPELAEVRDAVRVDGTWSIQTVGQTQLDTSGGPLWALALPGSLTVGAAALGVQFDDYFTVFQTTGSDWQKQPLPHTCPCAPAGLAAVAGRVAWFHTDFESLLLSEQLPTGEWSEPQVVDPGANARHLSSVVDGPRTLVFYSRPSTGQPNRAVLRQGELRAG